MNDPKRATEIFLCEKLSAAVPGHQFVPFHGGGTNIDPSEMEPPFTVVMLDDAERTHATEGTWICNGNIQTITHSKETSIQAHSELSRAVYAALASIPSSYTSDFAFHGIDISKVSTSEEESLQCRANIVGFTCGVGS